MTLVLAQQVLTEIRALGISVRAAGGSIRFQPRKAMPPALAERARACKAELLRLLEPDPGRPDRVVLDGRECEIIWLDAALTPPESECRCCGHRSWWRLRGTDDPKGRPWMCGHCHPPIPPPDAIEWYGRSGS